MSGGLQADMSIAIPTCRVCGCTDEDCSACILRTGHPCHWIEPDLCSACVEFINTPPPSEAQLRRILWAFDHDQKLCVVCNLGFREYWQCVVDADADPPIPLCIKDELRLPMCRSSQQVCGGMRTVYAIKFGKPAARRIMRDAPNLWLS